jgi:hypothetical protein
MGSQEYRRSRRSLRCYYLALVQELAFEQGQGYCGLRRALVPCLGLLPRVVGYRF